MRRILGIQASVNGRDTFFLVQSVLGSSSLLLTLETQELLPDLNNRRE